MSAIGLQGRGEELLNFLFGVSGLAIETLNRRDETMVYSETTALNTHTIFMSCYFILFVFIFCFNPLPSRSPSSPTLLKRYPQIKRVENENTKALKTIFIYYFVIYFCFYLFIYLFIRFLLFLLIYFLFSFYFYFHFISFSNSKSNSNFNSNSNSNSNSKSNSRIDDSPFETGKEKKKTG